MRKKQYTNDEIKNAIWDLPFAERASMLTLSIIERHQNEPGAAVIALIELISRLSQYFSEDKRFRLADRLRTAADLCEKKVLAD
jgi:hypothetical protein